MSGTRRLILGAVAAVTLLSGMAPAYAEKGGNGNGNGHGKGKWEAEDRRHDDDSTLIKIYDNDRVVLRKYAEERYYQSCPPGLAKKNNGCQPPGQAKKRYVIGHSLPDDVVFYPVPRDVILRLEPVPVGYQYVRVDNDVLLINQASKKIIDAVTLLSAVN